MGKITFALLMLFSVSFPCGVLAVAASPAPEAGDMALIPAGDFSMGSPANGDYPPEETPRHKVYLDAFSIDRFEVTNELFSSFLNAVRTGDNFEEKRQEWVVIRNDLTKLEKKDWWPPEIMYENGKYQAVRGFEKHPVLSVSWHAADAYCRWAGKRLPTEAEWEKAARGGHQDWSYPWGDELPTEGIIFKKIWLNNLYPAPVENVGNYYPNGFGLYDVTGNVSEWCSDWFHTEYYKTSPSKNPKGPETGLNKVNRGGSWAGTAPFLRVAFRNYSLPEKLNSGVGIRCAKDATEK